MDHLQVATAAGLGQAAARAKNSLWVSCVGSRDCPLLPSRAH